MNCKISLLAAIALALGVPTLASAGDAEAGKALYMANCMSCHGTAGKGDGPVGMALNPKPRDFSAGEFKLDPTGDGETGTDEDLAKVIKQGAAAFGGSPLMAPWGQFSDEQIADLIAYIHSLKQ